MRQRIRVGSIPFVVLTVLALSLTLVGLAPSSAAAQLRQTSPTYTQRGALERDVTIRIDSGPPDRTLLDSGEVGEGYGLRLLRVDVPPDVDDTYLSWGVGIAITPVRRFELGIQFAPVLYVPRTRYGDLESYGRFLIFGSRHVDIAAQLVLQFPTRNDFGMGFGVPMVFRLHPRVRLDVGVELELVIYNAPDGDRDVRPNFDLPVALAFNLTPRFFVGARAGVFVYDFRDASAPFGGFVGYTVGRRHTADFTAAFTGYFGDTNRVWELILGITGRFWLG
jgi:hypothetical protein